MPKDVKTPKTWYCMNRKTASRSNDQSAGQDEYSDGLVAQMRGDDSPPAK